MSQQDLGKSDVEQLKNGGDLSSHEAYRLSLSKSSKKETEGIHPGLSWIRHFSVLVGGVIFFFLQGPEFVFHLWDHLYEGGDSFINSWILAWNAHALFKSGISVWNAPIFYPVKNTFALSETMFGNLWITLPVQYLTNNPTFAANILALASFVLAMYFVFLLVHDVTGSFWAGMIGGILFSFNPYRWGHVGHLQLLPFFWAPLALLFVNRFMEDLQWRSFFGVLIPTWIQYYASIYLGTMLLTLLVVLFLVDLMLERRGTERWKYLTNVRLLKMFLTGATLSGLVLLPLGLPYVSVAKEWQFFRTLGENSINSAEPLSFLIPGSFKNYSWINHLSDGVVRGGEGAVFFGLTPWVLAALGMIFVRHRRFDSAPSHVRVIRRYAWAALIIGILMLGPYLIILNHKTKIPMPYFLVYYLIPGGSAMRVPARFAQPLLLCLVVIGSFATIHLCHMWKKWSVRWRIASVLLTGLLFYADYAVVENSGVLAETQDKFPPVYTYLANLGVDRPLLELPMESPITPSSYKYLHYQTLHWRPELGGTSGQHPPGRFALTERTMDCPSEKCFRFISISPALTVVVHLDRYSETKKTAWEAEDLTPYGFRFVNRIGDALVWEREQGPVPSSAKLSIMRSFFFIEKGALRVALLLRPGEKGEPWRHLSRGATDVTIFLESKQGEQYKYVKRLRIPSYLLPDEIGTGELEEIKSVPENITKLRIEGPLVGNFSVDYTSPALLSDRNTSKDRNSGLRADIYHLVPSVSALAISPTEEIRIEAEVSNAGKAYWLDENYVRIRGGVFAGHVSLGVLWFRQKEVSSCKKPSISALAEGRLPITSIIAPGETVKLESSIRAPQDPGRYMLLLEMVSDGVTWFNDVGDSFVKCFEVTVESMKSKEQL